MTHINAGAELDPVHPVPLPTRRRAVGLTSAEVAERVARGEVNDVPVRSSRSTVDIVRANVFTRFNAIIGVLWLIMLWVAPIQDSLFGFVILANTGIGIVQEWRAKKTLDSLALIGKVRPTVRRDGVAVEVSTSEIVLGDLIEIGPETRSSSTVSAWRPTAWRSTSHSSPVRRTPSSSDLATRSCPAVSSSRAAPSRPPRSGARPTRRSSPTAVAAVALEFL